MVFSYKAVSKTIIYRKNTKFMISHKKHKEKKILPANHAKGTLTGKD